MGRGVRPTGLTFISDVDLHHVGSQLGGIRRAQSSVIGVTGVVDIVPICGAKKGRDDLLQHMNVQGGTEFPHLTKTGGIGHRLVLKERESWGS